MGTATAYRRGLERLSALVRELPEEEQAAPEADYRGNPALYCDQKLHVKLTAQQEAIITSVVRPPYKTLVKSGHNVGKTFLGACLINWFFDSFVPGVCLSTAPKKEQVEGVLWKEVRRLRFQAGLGNDFIGPAAPCLRKSYNHFALGTTASNPIAFQGYHDSYLFFLLEECVGVNPFYWESIRTMHKGNGRQFCLAIGNPTTTVCQAYIEDGLTRPDGTPAWARFELNALDHPNIADGLAGREPSVPEAVDLGQVEEWINSDWFEPVPEEDVQEGDVEWPPTSGRYFRPGPEGEARVLGRWPSAGTFGVWSERLWALATGTTLQFGLPELPRIGCDVARYGNNNTCIHIRWGSCSLHHESHNGWDTVRTWNRLAELAEHWAKRATALGHVRAAPITTAQIKIMVDDTGVGGGVTDALRSFLDHHERPRYCAIGVNAGAQATSDRYPNLRSELWFQVAARAKAKRLDLHRLGQATLARLRMQAMAPKWKPNALRQRQLETKEEMEKDLRRSPDDMDALNLAYLEGLDFKAARPVDERPTPVVQVADRPVAGVLRMFGR